MGRYSTVAVPCLKGVTFWCGDDATTSLRTTRYSTKQNTKYQSFCFKGRVKKFRFQLTSPSAMLNAQCFQCFQCCQRHNDLHTFYHFLRCCPCTPTSKCPEGVCCCCTLHHPALHNCAAHCYIVITLLPVAPNPVLLLR